MKIEITETPYDGLAFPEVVRWPAWLARAVKDLYGASVTVSEGLRSKVRVTGVAEDAEEDAEDVAEGVRDAIPDLWEAFCEHGYKAKVRS